MKVDRDLCLHCGACVGMCPFNALYLDDTFLVFTDRCTNCGVCMNACPVGAISRDEPVGEGGTAAAGNTATGMIGGGGQ